MKQTLVHPAGPTDAIKLFQQGWSILVKQLGLQKAMEFTVLLERGKGDSVKDIAEYWGDTCIDKMHSEILSWKEKM
ncbi:MAG: hypothetical protein D3914_00360 [Candidatus Electrothrix sp. LOE2]|nr:hypothetical protein [Candidatus Electrothrix sp. LOE2]